MLFNESFPGAGRDDKLTIQAGGRDMKVEQVWDSKFVVTLADPAPASQPAPAASANSLP